MRTAVIAYGSLANQLTSNGTTLNVRKPNGTQRGYNLNANVPFVAANGLTLPTELGRLSSVNTQNRRITSVIQPGVPEQQAFFAISNYDNLNDSIGNLRRREGTTPNNISYVNLRTGRSRKKNQEVAEKIATWARENHFDAAIWTELPSNITKEEILTQVEQDSVLRENTKAYIQNLPNNLTHFQNEILNINGNNTFNFTEYMRERDRLPQCNKPRSQWQQDGIWGPDAAEYPQPEIPQGVNKEQWMRELVVAVAKRYEEERLKYKTDDGTRLGKRGHFPARGHGLDCSNFISWIYNYGLGIQFSSDVDAQRNPTIYRQTLGPMNTDRNICPQPGDLMYFKPFHGSNVAHVVMYVGKDNRGRDLVIDSTSGRSHVAVREANYWASRNSDRYLGFRSPISQACR